MANLEHLAMLAQGVQAFNMPEGLIFILANKLARRG